MKPFEKKPSGMSIAIVLGKHGDEAMKNEMAKAELSLVELAKKFETSKNPKEKGMLAEKIKALVDEEEDAGDDSADEFDEEDSK